MLYDTTLSKTLNFEKYTFDDKFLKNNLFNDNFSPRKCECHTMQVACHQLILL